MIDTELIVKAKKKSTLIEKIDASWREFTEGLKEGIFTVPFTGGYSCVIKEDDMLIEGYSGLLLIDKALL